MEVKLEFGDQKKCPFSLNRGVPSVEVINTKTMWKFFWDQISCPLNTGVRKERFHRITKAVQSITSAG